MARKFLYVVAALVVLVLAVLLALRFWAEDLTEYAFVPTARFAPQAPLAATVYAAPGMWIARPGSGRGGPAHWLPDGLPAGDGPVDAAVFFVHPTSYLARAHWNAPLDDGESRERADLFVRGMATPFNAAAELWVPRYRQAAFGAFLTDAPAAARALDAAYADVVLAFDHFVAQADPRRPIVLAGHSQGAYHLRRLLRDRVAGTGLSARVAAAYVIGWPVSLDHDLPAMGLAACAAPDQPGCVMSWLSFAEPADNAMLLRSYARKPGLDGTTVKDSAFLCTNPLTGAAAPAAPARANLGTLVPDAAMRSGRLMPAMVPARCGEDGFLYVGPPPELGPYVLPGNNYHLYDIPLFWANLRADFARRVQAWQARR